MIWAIAVLDGNPGNISPLGYVGADDLGVAIIRDINLTDLENKSEEFLIAAVVEHDRLICQLFERFTVLPLRFGTVFKSQAILAEYLGSHHGELKAKLAKLKGYGEYLITLTPQISEPWEPNVTANLHGKDYLLAKRAKFVAEQAKRSQRQEQCQELLAQINPEHQYTVVPQAGEFLRMYFLAREDEMILFQSFLERWQLQYPHWEVRLGSSLPPYHFCSYSV